MKISDIKDVIIGLDNNKLKLYLQKHCGYYFQTNIELGLDDVSKFFEKTIKKSRITKVLCNNINKKVYDSFEDDLIKNKSLSKIEISIISELLKVKTKQEQYRKLLDLDNYNGAFNTSNTTDGMEISKIEEYINEFLEYFCEEYNLYNIRAIVDHNTGTWIKAENSKNFNGDDIKYKNEKISCVFCQDNIESDETIIHFQNQNFYIKEECFYGKFGRDDDYDYKEYSIVMKDTFDEIKKINI